MPKRRSRACGCFFLSYSLDTLSKAWSNGQIHVICAAMKNIMASVVKREMAITFINVQESMPLRYAFQFLNHPQPITPTQVNNIAVVGFANNTIKIILQVSR